MRPSQMLMMVKTVRRTLISLLLLRNSNDPHTAEDTLPDPVTDAVVKKDVVRMSLTGLVSQNSEQDTLFRVVVFGGDKQRIANVAWLRELVPAGRAISGIELAVDKQANG